VVWRGADSWFGEARTTSHGPAGVRLEAQALATLYQKRRTEEDWKKERLVPMLAGLLELVPWVKQWHNAPNDEFGGLRLGDYFETFLAAQCRDFCVTREELRGWRPEGKKRGKTAGRKKTGGGGGGGIGVEIRICRDPDL